MLDRYSYYDYSLFRGEFMELRVLEYFLAISREQSISGAAKSLHLSQPTLSRQIKDLEDELGKTLIIRGNRKISLTEEGMILRKRAEEIISLMHKTENEITLSDNELAGDIHIGTGETGAFRLLAKITRQLQLEYPHIRYHIVSDDSIDVIEGLDRGLIDFGIIFEPCDLTKYEYIRLPIQDEWGVLMHQESPLAHKKTITYQDIIDQPLIMSRQVTDHSLLMQWLKSNLSDLNIVATYNLVYNASLLVEEQLGYALTLRGLLNTTGQSPLCFKPLSPTLNIGMYILWKKYQVFPKHIEKFLIKLKENMIKVEE